jgi:UMF1 family MFS transporter
MLHWSEVRKLKNTFIYLSAWFLLSDGRQFLSLRCLTALLIGRSVGFTTITSTAILFRKTVHCMPPSSLILIGIFTPTSGILGEEIWLVEPTRSYYPCLDGVRRTSVWVLPVTR